MSMVADLLQDQVTARQRPLQRRVCDFLFGQGQLDHIRPFDILAPRMCQTSNDSTGT